MKAAPRSPPAALNESRPCLVAASCDRGRPLPRSLRQRRRLLFRRHPCGGGSLGAHSPIPCASACVAAKGEHLRWLFGISLVVCHSLHSLMAPLHTGFVDYYLKTVTHPGRALVMVLRFGGLGLMLGLCVVEMAPWAFAIVQAAGAVYECLLLHLDVRFFGLPGHEHDAHHHHHDPNRDSDEESEDEGEGAGLSGGDEQGREQHALSTASTRSARHNRLRKGVSAARFFDVGDPVAPRDKAISIVELTHAEIFASEVDSTARALNRAKKQRPSLLIDPRNSQGLFVWDIVIGIALTYTAVITPYEVSYINPPKSSTEAFFIINQTLTGAPPPPTVSPIIDSWSINPHGPLPPNCSSTLPESERTAPPPCRNPKEAHATAL